MRLPGLRGKGLGPSFEKRRSALVALRSGCDLRPWAGRLRRPPGKARYGMRPRAQAAGPSHRPGPRLKGARDSCFDKVLSLLAAACVARSRGPRTEANLPIIFAAGLARPKRSAKNLASVMWHLAAGAEGRFAAPTLQLAGERPRQLLERMGGPKAPTHSPRRCPIFSAVPGTAFAIAAGHRRFGPFGLDGGLAALSSWRHK